MGVFEYKSLPGLRWIRLLKVISQGGSGPLFELVEQKLGDEALGYEAVSYAWGNTILSAHLELTDGQRLPVTASLASAMPCLISASSTGLLWIDQISINQSDLEERNSQVSQMGEIYSGAERVLIWLGHDTRNDMELLQEMFDAVGSQPDAPHPCGAKEIMDPIVAKLMPLIDLERPAGMLEPSRGQQRREAITSLLSRAWWKRAWVFQETVLAKKLKVLFGNNSIEWRDIEHVAEGVFDIEYAHGTGGYRNTICKRATGWDSYQFMMHKQWELKETGTLDRFLGFMSQVGGDFQTTDARDFIFAFAGLINSEGVKFIPDYSQTVQQVYASAARAFIETTGSLDVLAFVSGVKHYQRPGLPTWCPDWSRSMVMPMPVHDAIQPSVFHAAATFEHKVEKPKTKVDPNILLVRGKLIDEIKYVHAIHMFERHYFMDDLHRYLDIEGHYKALNHANRPPYPSVSHQRILRAIVADERESKLNRGEDGYLLASHIDSLWEQYVQYPTNRAGYDTAKDKRQRFPMLWKLQQASLVTQSKRVFVSNGGKVGLTPKESRNGDKVCVLHGAKAPVVLRANVDGTWMPVGMCFLEGVMFGEAVTWREEKADVFRLS